MVDYVPENKPFYPTDHCGVIRIKNDNILPKYLVYALQIEGEYERFSRSNRASTQRVASLVIQVPEIDVQKKIVAEMESIDAKISAEDDKLKKFDEDIKSKFVEMFITGNPYQRKPLKGYITQVKGVSYKPVDLRTALDENSVLLLRANNISEGIINHHDVQYVKSEKVSDVQLIKNGDILICGSSGSLEHVGKSAICTQSVVGETFGTFCKLIRANGKLQPKYIATYFETDEYRKIIMDLASGSNINNLKTEHINDLLIPVPDDLAQQHFITFAKAIDKLRFVIFDSW